MKTLSIPLLAFLITGCTSFHSKYAYNPEKSYHSQGFQVVLRERPDRNSEPEYVLGFVIDAASPSLPTQAILWRSYTPLGNRINSDTSVGVSVIDGKDFSPPLNQGSGIYALRPDGSTAKLPIGPERATELANEFRKGPKFGLAAVPRILNETRTTDLLSTFDRLE